MIRPATPDDTLMMVALAVASDLFQPADIDYLRGMLTDYFGNDSDPVGSWIVDRHENGDLAGLAFYEQEPFTVGTWNLQLIAVHPDHQRRGRGTRMIRYIEANLLGSGGRLLLVETSGLPSFERTREFYLKYGFGEEAHIRDFYDAGEDKVIFRKLLAVS